MFRRRRKGGCGFDLRPKAPARPSPCSFEAVAGSVNAAVREALHDPDLPEGLPAVEVLRHHACREMLQLPVVSWLRQGNVPDVVVNVEMLVVHPHGMILDGHIRQPLAIAGNEVRPGGDVVANPIDVDAAIGCLQRFGFKCRRAGDVHRAGRRLHEKKRVVEKGETVVIIRGHRDFLWHWREWGDCG
jgi:hypothetical protein